MESPFISVSAKKQAFIVEVEQVCRAVDRTREALDAARQSFAATCFDVAELNAQQTAVQYLDVGGTPFHTTAEVLCRWGPHMLSILSSAEFANEAGEDGYVFVDRDGRWFSAVLAYLRDGLLDMPPAVPDRRALAREARFYLLPALHDVAREEECIVVVGKGMLQSYYPPTHTWHALHVEGLVPMAATKVGPELLIANADPDPRQPGQLLRLDRRTATLERVAPLPDHFSVQTGSGVQDQFVLFGFDSHGPRRLRLVMFHLPVQAWVGWGEVLHGRQKFAACELEGRIVVIGGRDLDSVPLASVEECVLSTAPHWRALPPMAEKRSRPGAVVWRDRLVVLGGYNNEHGSLSSVEMFDPLTRAWQSLPPMQTPRIGCRAVVFDGDIVVLGGFATSNSSEYRAVERFDARAGRWERLPSMCEAPVDPCVAVLGIPSSSLPHFFARPRPSPPPAGT
eukprot:EG_transcript_10717